MIKPPPKTSNWVVVVSIDFKTSASIRQKTENVKNGYSIPQVLLCGWWWWCKLPSLNPKIRQFKPVTSVTKLWRLVMSSTSSWSLCLFYRPKINFQWRQPKWKMTSPFKFTFETNSVVKVSITYTTLEIKR